MTVSVQARFYQSARGAALQAQGLSSFENAAEWDDGIEDGFGVKATSAAPTNLSDFGGHTITGADGAMDETVSVLIIHSRPSNVTLSKVGSYSYRKKKTLDANWAAGKYAFAYSSIADGVIAKASPPFLIR